MKKILFIDRDGTLIWEPPDTFQIDSFEKLHFLPGVITFLRKIYQTREYIFVMVTNQDGLGTEKYPEETFWPVQNFIMETFEREGIRFEEVCIDKSYPEENLPTRKPGTGMLTKYLNSPFLDVANSYVIGDRITDVKLAQNIGCKAIFLRNYDKPDGYEDSIAHICRDWESVYNFLVSPPRVAKVHRKTNETDIEIYLNLDGVAYGEISTGLNFFDHMLEQIVRHCYIEMKIRAKGDLHIDEHHTIEDTGIALGEAFAKALGNKRGIERYGFLLPMDDCLAQVAIDFGGRPWIEWDVEFRRERIGDVPTEMFFHFFKSFSDAAKCNLNIRAEGENEHHKIESVFKAFAKAMRMAIKRNIGDQSLPSTKGIL